MARLVGITYAGVIVGLSQTDTSYILSGRYNYAESYTEASVSFEVEVANATRATFLASEAALIAAFTKPDQDLTIVLGATTRHTYSHSGNTGFLARPSIRKIGGTGNSARYACSVTVQLSADLAGRGGRVESTVDLDTRANGARALTVSGSYTAVPGTNARANYAANIATYLSGILTGFGGTWNALDIKAVSDDQDKLLRFSHEYEEIIFDEALGSTDHAAIKNPRLVITRDLEGLRRSAGVDLGLKVTPLQGLSVEYSADVDKASTQDLETLWADTIRPLILSQASLHTGDDGGTTVVESENVSVDPTSNRLLANVRLLVDQGGSLTRALVTFTDSIELGIIFRNVWNGDPLARDIYHGPTSHVRNVRWTYTYRDTGPDPTDGRTPDGFLPLAAWQTFDGFFLVRVVEGPRSRWSQGLPNGDQLDFVTASKAFVYVRANVTEGNGTTTTTTPSPPSDPTRTRVRGSAVSSSLVSRPRR